jgi:hypothetical protein
MRRVLIVLGVASGMLGAGGCRRSAAPQDEAGVWRAVIGYIAIRSQTVIVLDRTLERSALGEPIGCQELTARWAAQQKLPAARLQALCAGLQSATRAPAAFPASVLSDNLGRTVAARDTRALLQGEPGAWQSLRRESAQATRVLGVSRVAFQLLHALVYVEEIGEGDGRGTLYLLEKVDRGWKLRAADNLWVT